jgi:crossover junction endodeoxyribonuclease RuvC
LKVLGVDPGLSVTGYGLLEIKNGQPTLAEAGVVRTPRQAAIEARLASLYNGLTEIIQEYSPDVLAIEEVYIKGARPETGLKMGHARGVLFLAAAKRGVPVVSYQATGVKKALTGNGRASKEQVQAMVKIILGLDSLPQPVDVSDALAVALCYCNKLAHTGRNDL